MPEGRLSVRWNVLEDEDEPRLVLEWREANGPPVRAPRKTGFGSRLIVGSTEGNLNGSVDFDYAREGLRCRLDLRRFAEGIARESFAAAMQ